MLTTLSPETSPRTFCRRELLPLEPDVLWLIDRGAVRTSTWNDDGSTITLGYWGSKDVVGMPLSRLSPYQIECLTSVEATPLTREQWHILGEAMIRHCHQSEQLLHITRSGKIKQRLHYFLFWLSHKFGRVVDLGYLIDLRLTHQELADVIGTTRVTVTRLLREFEEEQVIERVRGHLIIRQAG